MRVFVIFFALLVPAIALAQAPAAAGGGPQTDDEKTLYAVGLVLSRSLREFDMSPSELEVVRRALADAYAGKPAIDLEEWGPRIQALADARGERVVAREKQAGVAYLTKAAAAANATTTASGIVYVETQAGTGATPAATDRVKVNYRGTLINGTEFDSSYARNEPAEFPLSGVIRCWTEGLQRMKVGGKARLVCPSDLAYGDRANDVIPGGSVLVFDIELLDVLGSSPLPN
jgi:FKBP-type peptidyl-prolyl cis-trans isomerase FkpA